MRMELKQEFITLFFIMIAVVSCRPSSSPCEHWDDVNYGETKYMCEKPNSAVYYHCIWNDDAYSYTSRNVSTCPSGLRCHCFNGDLCDEEGSLCVPPREEPTPLVDAGFLDIRTEHFSDDYSEDDAAKSGITEVVSYKLPSGKYYREERKEFQWMQYFERVLYVPKTNRDGFVKYYKRDGQECKVSEEDASESLVKHQIKSEAIRRKDGEGVDVQVWYWKSHHQSNEFDWNYNLREYQGRLVPVYHFDSELYSGAGYEPYESNESRFTYSPVLGDETQMKKRIMKEDKLIKDCTKKLKDFSV